MGVANRRAFDERLEHECRRALRDGPCFALLLLDLDQFTSIDDRHGHAAGDHAVRVAAGPPAASTALEVGALVLPGTMIEVEAVAVLEGRDRAGRVDLRYSCTAMLPPPNAPIPQQPAALVARYDATIAPLRAALDRWQGNGPTPRDVQLLALYQQRVIRLLAARPRLAARVLPREPGLRDDVAALVDLQRLAAPYPARKRVVVARPRPPLRLRRWYAQAQRRFGVPWNVLAAVNFVESAFGKLRNDSVAGAQGPMQFMPSTWRAYGLGGDVHDPPDAILGAANYLRASGAPGDLRTALHHYNPSRLYVDAVLRYARRIGRDRRAFLRYYAWSVFVRTTDGVRRVTGPR